MALESLIAGFKALCGENTVYDMTDICMAVRLTYLIEV
jgi:hypothetical protein